MYVFRSSSGKTVRDDLTNFPSENGIPFWKTSPHMESKNSCLKSAGVYRSSINLDRINGVFKTHDAPGPDGNWKVAAISLEIASSDIL